MDAENLFATQKWEVVEACRGTPEGKSVIEEYFVRREDDDVAIASDIIDPDTFKPSEAHARLIAAAPRLLAAAVATLEENAHLADGDVCTLRELKRAVQEALGVSDE